VNLATIVDSHPDAAVAVIDGDATTTYGELRGQAAGLRGGFARLGLEPGDRVAIVGGNDRSFVVAYLAALGAGLITVPLNPLSPARELERELAAIGARAVVVGASARGSFASLDRAAAPTVEHVIDAGDELDELIATDPAPPVDRDDDDLAVMMFTSGTAGSPKAAMLSHGNLRANLEQAQAHAGRAQNELDVSFGLLPLFHIFGLNVVLGLTLYTGARIVLVDRFDPAASLKLIRDHGVTIVSGAPTMWGAWAALPDIDARAFASVRIAASGAAKLPLEIAEAVERRFGLILSEGYGLTEASPIVTSSTGVNTKYGSIGVPLPGVEVRLVDPDGDDVLVGDSGELWVRGPNVFKGYWNDPEATRAALTPDGWLRTGDIGVVDDDGFLYLVDRAKDLIIVSGFNVYPAEVEDVIAELPGVDAVAVVGVAHPQSGETVKAYVIAAEGETLTEAQVIDFCADNLARYKCPSSVEFVDELPLGLGGKLLRRALR
jgi:long-chain acyl-CoA synthetase